MTGISSLQLGGFSPALRNKGGDNFLFLIEGALFRDVGMGEAAGGGDLLELTLFADWIEEAAAEVGNRPSPIVSVHI